MKKSPHPAMTKSNLTALKKKEKLSSHQQDERKRRKPDSSRRDVNLFLLDTGEG